MLLDWGCDLKPDDFEVGVFRIPSNWGDEDNELRCLLRFFRDSTELLQCLHSFRSFSLREERLALDSSSEVMRAEAGVEESGGDGISFVAGSSWLSSPSIALITRCLTKSATGAMKPG